MLCIGRGFGLLVRLLGSSGFFACGALSRLFAYGVGLSLHSYRSIRFAPVRGSTHFLCRRKESKQRKRASNRQPVGVHLGHPLGTAQGETRSRAAPVRDKALIRSSVALRAPPTGTTPSEKSVGKLNVDRSRLHRCVSRCWAHSLWKVSRTTKCRPATPTSPANPSATHAVRSGVDERCVTNAEIAGAGLVLGRFRRWTEMDTYRLAVGSPLSLLTFFAAAKKVSAAPHRGEANRPIRMQGKANAVGTTIETKAPQANSYVKKANAVSKPPKRRAGKKNLQHPRDQRQNHRQHKRRHKRKRILLPKQPKGHIARHPSNPKLTQPGPARRQNGHGDKRSQQPPNHREPLTEVNLTEVNSTEVPIHTNVFTTYASYPRWQTHRVSPQCPAKTQSP
jgi:hypothetical protein